MLDKAVSCVVVVDDNYPVAVVSHNEVINGILNKKTKIKDVMSKEFANVSKEMKLTEINNMMKEKKLKRFPVVENNRLIGLVTETDIINSTRDIIKIDLIIQESILIIFGFTTAFFLFYFSPF